MKRFSKTFKKSRIYYLLLFNFGLCWHNVLWGGVLEGREESGGAEGSGRTGGVESQRKGVPTRGFES
jgi:hypothetical protein